MSRKVELGLNHKDLEKTRGLACGPECEDYWWEECLLIHTRWDMLGHERNVIVLPILFRDKVLVAAMRVWDIVGQERQGQ